MKNILFCSFILLIFFSCNKTSKKSDNPSKEVKEPNETLRMVAKLADLVILDNNPLTIDADKLRAIKVMKTIKEGKTIYERPAQ